MPKTKAAEEKFVLEDAFSSLDEMIERLESPDITLEESFETYQAGMKLLKQCDAEIDQVEKKVLVLNEKGETDEFRGDIKQQGS